MGSAGPAGGRRGVAARAAERDRAGGQYAVMLASGRPLAIIETAWRDAYCAVWFFDDQLRRVSQVDCRRLTDGRLFVVRSCQWAYTEPDQAEFDERVAWGEFETSTDGRQSRSTFAGSGFPAARPSMVIPEDLWLDAPEFGDWGPFIRAFPGHLAALGHQLSATAVIVGVSDPAGEGLPAGMRPWRPPRPLQPAHLDLLFSPGARLLVGTSEPIQGVGGTVIVEVQRAGTLRMPSGEPVACTRPASM